VVHAIVKDMRLDRLDLKVLPARTLRVVKLVLHIHLNVSGLLSMAGVLPMSMCLRHSLEDLLNMDLRH